MELLGQLFEGHALKARLESDLLISRSEVIVISAFITGGAISWLLKTIPRSTKTNIVCRLNPADIAAGSTDINALKEALNNGISVACLRSLHAKIYSIDKEKIYV